MFYIYFLLELQKGCLKCAIYHLIFLMYIFGYRQQSDRKMAKSYFIDDRFRYRRATGEGRTDECRGNWSHESSGRTSSDKIHYI